MSDHCKHSHNNRILHFHSCTLTEYYFHLFCYDSHQKLHLPLHYLLLQTQENKAHLPSTICIIKILDIFTIFICFGFIIRIFTYRIIRLLLLGIISSTCRILRYSPLIFTVSVLLLSVFASLKSILVQFPLFSSSEEIKYCSTYGL